MQFQLWQAIGRAGDRQRNGSAVRMLSDQILPGGKSVARGDLQREALSGAAGVAYTSEIEQPGWEVVDSAGNRSTFSST